MAITAPQYFMRYAYKAEVEFTTEEKAEALLLQNEVIPYASYFESDNLYKVGDIVNKDPAIKTIFKYWVKTNNIRVTQTYHDYSFV